MPASSYIGNKSSDVVGEIKFSPNNFIETKYNFSMDNNLDELKYNDITAEFKVNNFLTSFKYVEEGDSIGTEHY